MMRKKAIALLVLLSICNLSLASEKELSTTETNNENKTVDWYLEHPNDLAAKILDCSTPEAIDGDCDLALEAMLVSMK
ncbi:hypothetical protein VQ643_14530 [Pseudomonas sp. F1_0610]|uniref:hypothetical protein n=1 Tax=Pseudomonas sp. F1_0610 TaxID=3114284 RepID=UPI0039C1DE7D